MSKYKVSNGNVLEIVTDSNPPNPRTEWDNLGTMVCFHKRYNLGDKHDYRHGDYGSWDEMKDAIIKNENVAVIKPLYLYDHSGITISTGEFSNKWDSGQVGFIFISKAKVRKEYSVKRISKKLLAKIETYIDGEVETYDQYLTGDVYGFKLYNSEGEEIDSCWGFYGSDYKTNGIKDHIEGDIIDGEITD